MSDVVQTTARLDVRGCLAAALILLMLTGMMGIVAPLFLAHTSPPEGASCALQARWGAASVLVPAEGCNNTARFAVVVPTAGRAFVSALGFASAGIAVGLDCTPFLSIDPAGVSAADWGAAFELGPAYAGTVPCELVFCSATGAPSEVNTTAVVVIAATL